MPASRFVSHARTLDELRAEFISDLHRRLASLDAQSKFEKNATRASALARAKREIEDVIEYWLEVEVRTRSRKGEST